MAGETPARPVEVIVEAPKEKAEKRKSKSVSLSNAIDAVTVGAFNLTAVLTRHEHWLKDKEEVAPIVEPLHAWMEQLPPKLLKKLEANLCPFLFVLGIGQVLVPDIVLEMQLRAKHRHFAGQASQRAAGPVPLEVAPGGLAGYAPTHGNGRPASRDAGASPPDPSLPPRIPGVDF